MLLCFGNFVGFGISGFVQWRDVWEDVFVNVKRSGVCFSWPI